MLELVISLLFLTHPVLFDDPTPYHLGDRDFRVEFRAKPKAKLWVPVLEQGYNPPGPHTGKNWISYKCEVNENHGFLFGWTDLSGKYHVYRTGTPDYQDEWHNFCVERNSNVLTMNDNGGIWEFPMVGTVKPNPDQPMRFGQLSINGAVVNIQMRGVIENFRMWVER